MDFHSSFKKKTYEQEPILSKHHPLTMSHDVISSGDGPVLTSPSPHKSHGSGKMTGSARVVSGSSEEECGEVPLRAMTRSRLLDPRPKTDSGRVRSNLVEEDPEEDQLDEDIPEKFKRDHQFNTFTVVQCVSLVLILGLLICTLFVGDMKEIKIKGFSMWKWEILAVALICGNLICGWGIRIIVLLIERNFMLRKRVLYFVYGLRNPVQNCLWLGVVLITWHSFFGEGEKNNKCLKLLSRVLICFFVGTLLWLVKTLFVKVLASLFHVSRYFDRIQESLFNQFVIEALTGPPIFESVGGSSEEDDSVSGKKWQWSRKEKFIEMQSEKEALGSESGGKYWLRKLKPTRVRKFTEMNKVGDIENGGESLDFDMTTNESKLQKTESQKEKERILLDPLHRMSSKNVSAWRMKRLIKLIRRGFVYTLDEQILDSTKEDEATQKIESEFEAKIVARKIFRNVAETESKFIYLEDVKHFMREDQALKTMSLLGGSPKTDKISKSVLKNWVVNAVRERRALALTLDDTKTAVNTLHQMVNVVVSIIIAIACFLILGILTSQILFFISSQILVAAFIFGNSCKIVFESIIFLFIIHPFDVGDRCEIDGVQMTVEEMNILSTVFLRFDNQKIVYPNNILSTKPINNYYRSPDMADTIDFYVHFATPTEIISIMKKRIISYIETKKEHWHSSPTIMLMNVEELTKVKFSIWLTHRMNHQDISEKWTRRALVVEEMIKIFNEFDIEYRILPVDVNILSMPSLSNS